MIIVGKIDVDAVERQLQQRFSDWTDPSQPQAVALGTPRPTQQSFEFIAEGAPGMLVLTWPLAPDNRPPTLAVEREHLVSQLGTAVLGMRLADRAQKPGSPLLQATAGVTPRIYTVAGQANLTMMAPAGQWPAALDAALDELRQRLAEGVRPTDMQRVLPTLRSGLQTAVARAPTRPHTAIAMALMHADAAGAVYVSAEQALAMAEPLLASITADEITAALRRNFGDAAPLLFRSASAGPVGADALTRQLAQALQRPLETRSDTVASWPYTEFGAPSAIHATTTDAALGTTSVQFANGTRLVVKSTPQERGAVGVQVRLGQGRAGIQPSQTHALWALESMPLGGTGQRSLAELTQWLQTHGTPLTVNLRADPQAFVLLGVSPPADLGTQLQLLAAYARDPGFRPELGERLQAMGSALSEALEAQPWAVYQRAVQQVMNGGAAPVNVVHLGRPDQAIIGWHWALPDHWTDPALAATGRVAAAVLGEVDRYEAVTAQQLQAFFRDRIAHRPPVEIAAKAKGAADAN